MTKNKYSVYEDNPQLNTICFYSKLSGGEPVEVLRIAKEGITANPDVPVDAAAAAVIRVLEGYIKNLTQRPWVGLTDEEIEAIKEKALTKQWAIRMALTAVKEKNT